MLTACWSVKGGSGTTVVAATLALELARAGHTVIAADLAGDVPAVLGVAEPEGAGLVDWLAAGPSVPADALDRLIVPTSCGLNLLARGGADAIQWGATADAGTRLAAALRRRGERDVVVDAGRADTPAVAGLVTAADRSLLVLRPCYLALRRAVAAPRPSAVVLICEPDRALGVADVEDVLGVPVLAQVEWDPAIARAVDAGLLSARLPRRLANALRGVGAPVAA